jgi:hypothetical protein
MSRYVGLLALLLGALLLVNFTSDALSAWAVIAHGEGDDGSTVAVAEVAMPNVMPLSGFIPTSTGRWAQGRVLAASATPSAQTCTHTLVSARR